MQTIYILEFYDVESTAEDNTIFQMTLQRMDISLLTLHQPNNDVFFKLYNHPKPIKFTVDDQKPQQIIYSLSKNSLLEIKVRIQLLRPEIKGDNYENIPEWWKNIELIS